MKLNPHVLGHALLAVGLVGCTSLVPAPLGTPGEPTRQGPAGEAPAAAVLSQVGVLNFRVHWPDRQAQAVPQEAQTVRVQVLTMSDQELANRVLSRPGTGQPLDTTARFELDPNVGKVKVKVEARSASGALLARGSRSDLPITDNTATSVVVVLHAVDGEGETVPLEVQLDLLKHLESYFSRFDKLLRYDQSDEFKRFADAGQSLVTPFTGLSGLFAGSTAWFGQPQGGSGATILRDPERSDFYVDLAGDWLSKVHWPGTVVENTLDEAGGTHRWDVALKPEGNGSDGTTAGVHVEATAVAWDPTYVLYPINDYLGIELHGLVGGMAATRSAFVLPTQIPRYSAMQNAKASAYFNPGGIAANGLSASVQFDELRDFTRTKLYRVTTAQNWQMMILGFIPLPAFSSSGQSEPISKPTSTPPPTPTSTSFQTTALDPSPSPTPVPYLTTHMVAQLDAPSAKLSVNVRLDDTMETASLAADLGARNNSGVMETFSINAQAGYDTGMVDGKENFTGFHTTVNVIDSSKLVRMLGSWTVKSDGTQNLVGRFEDIQTGTELGTVDWHADRTTDWGRLSSWPLIRFRDNTAVRLTPGFLSGAKDGDLLVRVQ